MEAPVKSERVYWPWLILVAGLALRIFVALLHMDQFHPDEHFQTLEPAGKVVYGFGWLSWEWDRGLRSWFVPALYVPILYVVKLCGVVGGPVAVYACRVFQALCSGFLLWGFHRLLERAHFRGWIRAGALGLLAFSPAMVAWGPATLSDNWALIFLWATMPFYLRWLFEDRPRDWFFAGLLLGITFLIRIQMVTWAGGVGLCLLFGLAGARKWKVAGLFTLGYLAAVGLQGVLDWITWGSFLHSVIMNIDMNFFQNVGATYGVAPWYEYFPLLTQNPGNLWIIGLIVLFVANLCTGSLRVRLGDCLIIVPAVAFLAAHMIIPHKEVRFLLPIFPAIVYVIALLGENLADKYGWEKLGPIAMGAASATLVLLAGSAVRGATDPAQYSLSNMTELIAAIRQDGELARHPDSCLLLVDHYWVWSHGELFQGHPVRWIESREDAIPDSALQECDYAITAGGAEGVFRARTAGRWSFLTRNKWSYALFKRN